MFTAFIHFALSDRRASLDEETEGLTIGLEFTVTCTTERVSVERGGAHQACGRQETTEPVTIRLTGP
jgi:hypothetical protein